LSWQLTISRYIHYCDSHWLLSLVLFSTGRESGGPVCGAGGMVGGDLPLQGVHFNAETKYKRVIWGKLMNAGGSH
jgi:hypothetical protein